MDVKHTYPAAFTEDALRSCGFENNKIKILWTFFNTKMLCAKHLKLEIHTVHYK